jgi:ethanolamine utilization cobalamin adenosyltransferase
VLENGGVERLVTLVNAMDMNLRLNAVWGLKNLLYQADSEIKQLVMKHLSYTTLENLLTEPDASIQEQALNLLRNLACGKEVVRTNV